MRKTFGKNKFQKAVYKRGEDHVSREQVTELLEMACSPDTEDRLSAAQYLCPCHIQGRIPAVWEAIYKLMEDEDKRIRMQAWHTLEDGGVPNDDETLDLIEKLYAKETDSKVKRFAEQIIGKELNERRKLTLAKLNLSTRPPVRQRGKCDFCGTSNIFVEYQFDIMIPDGNMDRAALVCDICAPNV